MEGKRRDKQKHDGARKAINETARNGERHAQK